MYDTPEVSGAETDIAVAFEHHEVIPPSSNDVLILLFLYHFELAQELKFQSILLTKNLAPLEKKSSGFSFCGKQGLPSTQYTNLLEI